MEKIKLGQKFWICSNNFTSQDYECKVIAIKTTEFLNGEKFIDFLVERTALNNYHESFKNKKDRTNEITYRYDYKEVTEWIEQNWPAPCSRWEKLEDKIFYKVPKRLKGII